MTSADLGIGNRLNRIVQDAYGALFEQGELAQLSHLAFEFAAKGINDGADNEIELDYPIGYRPTNQPMMSKRKYQKDELIQRYGHLAHSQLPVNGIYNLVTLIDSMLGDIIRAILVEFPEKAGRRRQIRAEEILKAKSIEELHLHVADLVLNELSYKSPRDFAEEATGILSINLLECPAFHVYIEVKATRDLHIHNHGVANDVYVRKAEAHARVRRGQALPITQIYFLQSYEAGLQFLEWLEQELHSVWHSSEYSERKQRRASG